MDDELIKLYAKIIERYKELIEEKEEKNIYELRKMIDPDDKTIRTLLETNKVENCEQLLQLIETLLKEIKNVYLPISFWMTYSEILEVKACEPLQKAMLLCSLVSNFTEDCYVCKNSNNIFLIFFYEAATYQINVSTGEIIKSEKKVDEIIKENEFCFNRNVYIENESNELE